MECELQTILFCETCETRGTCILLTIVSVQKNQRCADGLPFSKSSLSHMSHLSQIVKSAISQIYATIEAYSTNLSNVSRLSHGCLTVSHRVSQTGVFVEHSRGSTIARQRIGCHLFRLLAAARLCLR